MTYWTYEQWKWETYSPDPAEMPEAEAELRALADAYDPCVLDCRETYNGFSVLVIDRSGGLANFRVNVQLLDGLSMLWDDLDLSATWRCATRWRLLETGDENIEQKTFDAVVAYVEETGLFRRLPDGSWEETNPRKRPRRPF